MGSHRHGAGWRCTELLSEDDLELAGGRARLERARRLAGTIDDLYEDEWSICATVKDPGPHLAMIHHVGRPLGCECDCPDGAPGNWCEHVLAVGLSYLGDA